MRLIDSSVCRATGNKVAGLAVVLADQLMSAHVGAWLMPDEAERRPVLLRYFMSVLEHAVEYGQVDMTVDGAAVAVWYRRLEPMPPAALWMYDLHRVLGPHAARFALLHAYVDGVHPHTPHHHLAHVAVTAEGRQRGAGRFLLASYHRALNSERLPAYAEVSTDHPREGLLAGLGYVPRSPILLEPGGPVLWRMWRPPPGDQAAGDALPRRVRAHRTLTPVRGVVLSGSAFALTGTDP